MRFLVDECLYYSIVEHLRRAGHDVVWARDGMSQTSDARLLALAAQQNRVLMSEDRDFGSLIFRDLCPAFGVVLIKVAEFESTMDAVGAHVATIVADLGSQCVGRFIVIEPGNVRLRELPRQP